MAVWVRLLQNNIKSSPNFGKYYAKAVSTGEATLNDLMKDVQENTALKEADVVHVVKELHAVMKRRLADGQTIDIEEIGRFRLSVESECVDDKKEIQHPQTYPQGHLQVSSSQSSQARRHHTV